MIFIEVGQSPLSFRQATKRGKNHMLRELGAAGARPGDMDIFTAVPQSGLPQRLLDVLAALPGAPATYADYAAGWEADNVVNGAHNLFNHRLAAYRQAVARLAQYRLADGRPEITEEWGTGEYDPETGEELTETVVVQSAIAPLPAEIEQLVYDETTGEQTGTQMVPNPRIVQDDAERAQAQAVIDATPQEVTDWQSGPVV